MCILFHALSTYMSKSDSLIIIYASLFKCCFFYLISYHKAKVTLSIINCSSMLKTRKITAESHLMHGPGRQHHSWRWGPNGSESGNIRPVTCQEKKILRESWKLFSCTWRLILWKRDYQVPFVIFPYFSLGSPIKISWIEFKKCSLILYYIPGIGLGVQG